MKVGLIIYFKFVSFIYKDVFWFILIDEIGWDFVEGSENVKSFGKFRNFM